LRAQLISVFEREEGNVTLEERFDAPEMESLIKENNQLRLEVKKLTRQLNLANDNMIKYRSATSAKENINAVIAAIKSNQEKQLQVILENSLDHIILLDHELNFLLSTQSFLDLARIPSVGVLFQKSFRQVFSLFSDNIRVACIENIFKKALKTKEVQSSIEQLYVGEKRDARDYSVNIIPFVYCGGENDGLLVIFNDITERIEMENKIKQALNDAMAASKAKGDFLSSMSHEMRTPMNAIIGMTAIGKRANDVVEKNHAFNKIGDAASHLLGVINDILDMAKIEANKLELMPVEYNLEKMLQKVAAVINFRVDEKRQQFSVNIDKNVPRFIVGDDQRLAQVITNLLSNAVKFTPEEGNISLNVSFSGKVDENCVLRIEIIDSGIGISREQQGRLFNAFEQAESGISREYGGTGLGLVISKRIVELMGGRIWVESEPGKGSRFIFTVKTRRGDKSSCSLLLPGVNWKNLRILVIDDMAETHNQFRDLFDQLDIKCDVAADGFEALRVIEERGEYDIYFVDWRMPGMDGIELTRLIKSQCQAIRLVVIMIAALDWNQIRDEAIQAGVDKYLLKPLFSSAIVDCINECLGVGNTAVEPDNAAYAGEFTGKRLLLAEDIEINREILMALLDGTGLIIDCVENGQEALDIIEAVPNKYDIVFMDMQMPKMDGLEATRRIRALPGRRRERLPIIAMTANVFKDDIEACRKAGMDDHLGKPLDLDKVMKKLRKYINFSDH
jgi:signal transduction histidine kinase/DNA-binding response OmpR family regulator